MTNLSIKTVIGNDVSFYIPELARLRITVFREYPYLYDGSLEYEEQYLSVFSSCPESIAVMVFSGDKIVGVSTALPLSNAADEFQQPFIKRGYDSDKIFYLSESVILKEFRGQGLYKSFFEEREGYAKSLNRFDMTAFCAVERPENHLRKPSGYISLDNYWMKSGYKKQQEMMTMFPWKELDEADESLKPMMFWLKNINL